LGSADLAVGGNRHPSIVLVVPPPVLHPTRLKILEVVDQLELAGGHETPALLPRNVALLFVGVALGERRLLEQAGNHIQLLIDGVIAGQPIDGGGRV
jgi:hypothetical protein